MHPDRLRELPGGELVLRGLADTQDGRTTVESLLVAAKAPRLSALGLPAYGPTGEVPDPELSLYALLASVGTPDPYSRYNSLRREVASFVHALEHRIERERRLGSGASPG